MKLWHGGKRLHELPFLFHVDGKAAAGFRRLKGLQIHLIQLFTDCCLCFGKGKEALIPQSGEDPRRGVFDCPLRMGLVLRMLHTGRDDGDVVMLRQFLIAAVQNRLVSGILRDAGLQVIRNQEPRHAAEVGVCVNMTKQPVFQLHVWAHFHVGVSAARKYGDEEISRRTLARNGIPYRQGISSPVHLHDITGFMLDAHCGFRDPRPPAVLVPELCAHVRPFANLCAVPAVLVPKQGQRHTGLCQFPVNSSAVRLKVLALENKFLGEENLAKVFVRQTPSSGHSMPMACAAVRTSLTVLRELPTLAAICL